MNLEILRWILSWCAFFYQRRAGPQNTPHFGKIASTKEFSKNIARIGPAVYQQLGDIASQVTMPQGGRAHETPEPKFTNRRGPLAASHYGENKQVQGKSKALAAS